MVGEKSSLDNVLGPIANDYEAELYLPTGDISNTMIYQMAKIGAEDGRPMAVLYFADADPSGWNMAIAISRKLDAFDGCTFPDLEFQVHRVALTPDQVREFDLPSTPLKATESGPRRRRAMGVEQTEIDALATLRPDLLRQVARNAIAPFYDFTLSDRVREAPARLDQPVVGHSSTANSTVTSLSGFAPKRPRSSKRCETRSAHSTKHWKSQSTTSTCPASTSPKGA